MVANRARVVGLLVVTLVLGGCGSDPDPVPLQTVTPTPAAGSPTTSPSPMQTSRAVAPTAHPVMPELAKQRTPEGAEAFTAYWFELLNWGWISGDVEQLEFDTAEQCEYCVEMLDQIVEDHALGISFEGGMIYVEKIRLINSYEENDLIVFDLMYSQDAGRILMSDGTVRQDWPALPPVKRKVVVDWIDGYGWIMGGLGEEVRCADCG